jgi:flavin-dependent dehydrogenase
VSRGALDLRNVMRPAARHGLAFVGDAALATDPIFGVGLSWAFQSAEWLVDETVPGLLGDADLDAALARYRRAFLCRLGPHHLLIAEFSSGRKLYPWERAVFGAGTVEESVARAIEEVGSRRRSPLRLLDPRLAPAITRGMLRLRRQRPG